MFTPLLFNQIIRISLVLNILDAAPLCFLFLPLFFSTLFISVKSEVLVSHRVVLGLPPLEVLLKEVVVAFYLIILL